VVRKKIFKSFLIVTSALIFIAILGFVDYVTNPYLSFQIFYLIPIALVTWFAGRWMSIIPLAASAIAWFFDDVSYSHSYSHPLIPYWNIIAKIVFFIFIIYIMSKLKRILDQEKFFARIDYLTETANKRHFYEATLKEVSRSNRYKRPITIAYIDLDNLKRINDSFGHKAGDSALYQTADLLKKSVRTSDVVARIGGDEFAILFPETDYEASETIIQRIRKGLSDAIQKNAWATTLSIGAVTSVSHPCDLETLISNADSLMYSAKREGKGLIKHEILKGAART
jgi:diguanylate cyclase (GGDEF)-like protein